MSDKRGIADKIATIAINCAFATTGGNIQDNVAKSILESGLLCDEDPVHAKAELALRFLEHSLELNTSSLSGGLNKDTRKNFVEIEGYCWPILTEYFKP